LDCLCIAYAILITRSRPAAEQRYSALLESASRGGAPAEAELFDLGRPSRIGFTETEVG
jgi:hypothetical protein